MAVFGDLNKAEVIGNITQDLELRYTANGTPVVNFNVATNRRFKQGEEWQDEVTYHTIVVWAKDAENLTQRARKGTRLYVQGRLQTRSWEDADGKKNYKTEIVAERVILLDRYERTESDQMGGAQNSTNRPSKPRASKPAMSEETSNDDDVIDPDDLPF